MGLASVEINDATRSRLESLRDEIYRRTGTRVTNRDLLECCIANVSREEVIGAFRDEFEGLDEGERRRALGDTSDWDNEPIDGDIDENLYDE